VPRRLLSLAALVAVLSVPVAVPAAVADAAVVPDGVAAATTTYKTSAFQRAKRQGFLRTRLATPTAPLPTTTTKPATPASYADQVLALTNAERTGRGLRPLAFSGCADRFADSWAAALAKAGTLSHQPLNPVLSACAARRVGENVGYGNVTPAQLVRMWMDSPGHRANILEPAFTHLGVGAVTTSTGRVYGVQVFLTL
jgi:uncharacterized protein YkwD